MEGDVDPTLGKKIATLIYKAPPFIVYLDEKLELQWSFASIAKYPEAMGPVLNRVAEAHALSLCHLELEQRRTFRSWIGEAVARVLKSDDAVAANAALDKALAWLDSRNAEVTRLWYLGAGGVCLLLCVGPAALALFNLIVFGEPHRTVWLCVAMGALGSFLSVLQRSGRLASNPWSGRALHYVEGASRVFAGSAAALLIWLATKAGVLLSETSPDGQSVYVLLLTCAASGMSERAIPNLIEKLSLDSGAATPPAPGQADPLAAAPSPTGGAGAATAAVPAGVRATGPPLAEAAPPEEKARGPAA